MLKPLKTEIDVFEWVCNRLDTIDFLRECTDVESQWGYYEYAEFSHLLLSMAGQICHFTGIDSDRIEGFIRFYIKNKSHTTMIEIDNDEHNNESN